MRRLTTLSVRTLTLGPRLPGTLRGRRDAGEQSTGYILIVALTTTISLAVGAIVTNTLTSGAESIDLGLDP